MAVIRLKQYELIKLAEWIKEQEKAKRLDGLEHKTIAARAHQDLRLSVEVTEYHIKKVADMIGIKWKVPRQMKHVGNGCTNAAIASDLRELGSAFVKLMDELGIDKTKPLYQQAIKISAAGGFRESNAA